MGRTRIRYRQFKFTPDGTFPLTHQGDKRSATLHHPQEFQRTLRGPTFRDPTFSRFGPPPFGTPPIVVQKFNIPKLAEIELAEAEIGRSRTDGVCSVSSFSALSCFLIFIFLFLFLGGTSHGTASQPSACRNWLGRWESMGSSALRFLTASALKAERKLEEEEKEKAKVKKMKEEMEAAEHEGKMLELNRRL